MFLESSSSQGTMQVVTFVAGQNKGPHGEWQPRGLPSNPNFAPDELGDPG